MNATHTRRATLAPVAGFTHAFFAAFLTWHRKRSDRRIIDGLSQEQLKDIGFRRLPSGELERHESW